MKSHFHKLAVFLLAGLSGFAATYETSVWAVEKRSAFAVPEGERGGPKAMGAKSLSDSLKLQSLTDPEGALTSLEKSKHPNSDRLRGEILNRCLTVDYAKGKQLLLKTIGRKPDGSLDLKRVGIFAYESGMDIGIYRRIYLETSSDDRAQLLEGYAYRYADLSDLTAAFEPTEVPDSAKGMILRTLMESSPWAFESWLAKFPAEERAQQLMGRQFTRYVYDGPDYDPAQIARLYLEAIDNGQIPADQIRAVIDGMKGAESEVIMRCLARLSPEERKDNLSAEWVSLAKAAPLEKPAEVNALLEKTPDSARNAAAEALGKRLRKEDYREALQLANGVQDPAAKAKMEDEILADPHSEMPLTDLETACLAGAATAPDPEAYFPASDRLIRETADGDTDAAVSRLDKFPPGPLRDKLSVSLAKNWAPYDPERCSGWVATLPSGPARDQASAAVVSAAKDDPAGALKIAETISDSRLRLESAKKLIAYWRAVDPSYASQLLEQTSFSDEERKVLDSTPASIGWPPQKDDWPEDNRDDDDDDDD